MGVGGGPSAHAGRGPTTLPRAAAPAIPIPNLHRSRLERRVLALIWRIVNPPLQNCMNRDVVDSPAPEALAPERRLCQRGRSASRFTGGKLCVADLCKIRI